MVSGVECSIEIPIPQLLTDFYSILIKTTGFFILVEEIRTAIKAVNNLCTYVNGQQATESNTESSPEDHDWGLGRAASRQENLYGKSSHVLAQFVEYFWPNNVFEDDVMIYISKFFHLFIPFGFVA